MQKDERSELRLKALEAKIERIYIHLQSLEARIVPAELEAKIRAAVRHEMQQYSQEETIKPLSRSVLNLKEVLKTKITGLASHD